MRKPIRKTGSKKTTESIADSVTACGWILAGCVLVLVCCTIWGVVAW